VVTKSNGPLLLAGTRVTGTQPHLGTFYGWLRPVAAAAQEMPPYSPDTNQDEWVWNNVKTTQVGRKMITSVSDLYSNVLGALRRLQENPGIVRGFFGDPNLAYIAW